MPISGDVYLFTDQDITIASTDIGVYALYDDEAITIYVGKAEQENGIRGQLQAHKRGDKGKCTQSATFYAFEVCRNPSEREEELLIEHKLVYGKLPRYNERIA